MAPMLTDLVLFRHAKAVRHHEAPTDRDRALARAGAPAVLARMHEHFPTSAIAWLHRPDGAEGFTLKAYFARPNADE